MRFDENCYLRGKYMLWSWVFSDGEGWWGGFRVGYRCGGEVV